MFFDYALVRSGFVVWQRFPRIVSAYLLAACLLCSAGLNSALAQSDEPTFPREAINVGLTDSAETVFLDTPKATVKGFLAYTDAGDYATAAHYLDLTEIPPADQPDLGPELAQMLASVIDRRAFLSWDDLPDRPDGMTIAGDKNAPDVGVARRSIIVGVVNLDGEQISIRISRILPADKFSATGDGIDAVVPVWLFTAETLREIPRLYDMFGPTKLEQALPDWLKGKALFGLMWWELAALALTIALALGVGRVVFATIDRIKHMLPKNSTARAMLHSLRWPAVLVVVAWLAKLVTTQLFVFSSGISLWMGPLILTIFMVSILMFIVSLMDRISMNLVKSDPNDLAEPGTRSERALATSISAARKFLMVIATVAAIFYLVASSSVFPTLGASALVSAGAISLVLGFAAREMLSNIIASLTIALNQSARIGDKLLFRGYLCYVERINLSYVQLRIWDGNRLVVPVAEFVAEPFENWSLVDQTQIRLISLRMANSADIDDMRQAFQGFVRQEAENGSIRAEDAVARVVSQNAWGFELRFEIPTEDPSKGWEAECHIREQLIRHAAEQQESTGRRYFPLVNDGPDPEP